MKRITMLVAALAIVISACSGGNLVATVNGVDISSADVEKLIADSQTTAPPELYAQLIQTLIVHEVVSEAAFEEFGIEISQEELDGAIEELTVQIELSGGTLEDAASQQGLSMDAVPVIIEEDLTEQAIADALVASEPEPSEEDIEAAYNAALQSLTEVCASHILVVTEEEALAALERIEGGEAFADVATELGTDGTAEVGGDLGCAPAANYVAEFAIATIDADLDVPTGPVQTQFGFHLILVRERNQTPLSEVRADLAAGLVDQQRGTLLGDWMLAVISTADVSVVEEYGTWQLEPFPSVVPPAQ